MYVVSMLGDQRWVPPMKSLVPALEHESFAAVEIDAVPHLPSGAPLVVLAHWPSQLLSLPPTNAAVMPFLWDVWPAQLPDYSTGIRLCRAKLIFVTNRWSEAELRSAFPSLQIIYIPEAVDFDAYYSPRPLRSRTIGVLEFGRRHAAWHDAVTLSLRAENVTHRYSRSVNHFTHHDLFDTRAELIEGMRDSVISVCFPASVTDPDRVGGVEALTARYFESMAAGCLIVGYCPSELVDLLGYDPVCEVDWHDPAGQVLRLLRTCDSWQSQITRTQERMRQEGDWRDRAVRISAAVGHARSLSQEGR